MRSMSCLDGKSFLRFGKPVSRLDWRVDIIARTQLGMPYHSVCVPLTNCNQKHECRGQARTATNPVDSLLSARKVKR